MKQKNHTREAPEDAPVSRKKAIEIGALIDFTNAEDRDVLLKFNFPLPIAITYPAYCEAIYCSKERKTAVDTISPGLFAVLQSLNAAIRDGKLDQATHFEVAPPDVGQPPTKFVCLSELDDDGSPVLTIMTPDEFNDYRKYLPSNFSSAVSSTA